MQLYTIYLYLETALCVSGGTPTHHQERTKLFKTAGIRLTVTVTCRYRGIFGTGTVEVTTETYRAVSRYK
jgi:hypothetical protein